MAKLITEIPTLPLRAADAHKGLFGKILIIGGSRGMIGAPGLAANAALRSGAGLVRIATGQTIQLTVASLAPCATSIPLPDDESGFISAGALGDILNLLSDNDTVALGPGLGQSGDLQKIVEKLITDCDKPLIIDADGLNNLSTIADSNLKLKPTSILTPHPGEMKRLWHAWFREALPADRTEQAEKLARKCGAIIVLKGAGTVVTDGEKTYINDTGNPGMATAGSGDVLTGIITALAANQSANFTPLQAAILATFIHGRAGDLAATLTTETALTATDIIDSLPDAWHSFIT
ncbi:MAG: NAD(P)H-hydrate dehydratase [Sedimentisphaerales bacterium]|nr:NAD(P)H-hydrate dehydratase [Sedimentisphaerales bacterium]